MPAPLHLLLDLDGAGWHPAAWRSSPDGPEGVFSPRRLRRFADAAQAAGLSALTFEDSVLPDPRQPAGHLDAVQRAAFLAGTTQGIGLVPVVATTYTEPFHVAAQLASLDHSSLGRGGWLAATSPDPASARAVGLPVADGARRREELADVVATVRALWDSWEDDAVVRDVATGRYVDRDRVHAVDVVTQHWSVKGPLTVPRPPQGQPLVLARAVDVATPGAEVEVDVLLHDDVAGRVRGGAGPLAALDLEVVLDTAVPAAQRLAALDAAADGSAAPPGPRARFTGSGAALGRFLVETAATADAVRLHLAVLDEDLPVLLRETLPVLRLARALTAPLPGASLRSTFGLSRPANRHAARPALQEARR